MITNGTVTINERTYKAYVFEQNKITADDMGERFDRTVTVRVPIVQNEEINVEIGGFVTVDEVKWKVVETTCNRTGCNPHYHLKGVR